MTWLELWKNYINIAPGIDQIALRLACAMLVGSIVGLEREFTHRPAGLRTHILVALGACVVSILGEMLFTQYSALGASPDPARLSAQVITGVGFLGAGTIMKEGVSVKGLTTAAGVWAVACLGIAAGFGYYVLSLMGMVFTLVTLTIFDNLQRFLVHNHSAQDQYILLCTDTEAVLTQITACAKHPKLTIFDLTVSREGELYQVSFRVWFVGRKQDRRRGSFCARLAKADGVISIRNSSAEAKV
jgi:putative Mg2+ transporter-C (MgtC) family protein